MSKTKADRGFVLSVVESLYGNTRYQCPTCGERIRVGHRQEEKIREHLDWHFTNAPKATKECADSRQWWSTTAGHVEQPSPKRRKTTIGVEADVVAHVKDSKVRCTVCHEGIEESWDEERERWLLKDVIAFNDGDVAHVSCINAIIRTAKKKN
jgi:DNA-directed RNA polymerase subunit RPC12/RpoP